MSGVYILKTCEISSEDNISRNGIKLFLLNVSIIFSVNKWRKNFYMNRITDHENKLCHIKCRNVSDVYRNNIPGVIRETSFHIVREYNLFPFLSFSVYLLFKFVKMHFYKFPQLIVMRRNSFVCLCIWAIALIYNNFYVKLSIVNMTNT